MIGFSQETHPYQKVISKIKSKYNYPQDKNKPIFSTMLQNGSNQRLLRNLNIRFFR